MASVTLARLVLHKRDAQRVALQASFGQRQRLESLGLLAGGVAHDFNNLLTVIRMSTKLLGESALTPDQRADLDLIRDAEKSASQLTQKLLMLGNKQPMRVESTEINGIIEGFVTLVRRLLPANVE